MEHLSLASPVFAAPGESTSIIASRDSEHVLDQLRTSISASNLSLDAMLDSIVQAARTVVYADGAAIAMRRDNLVVCQARAGNMAPELGTELDADSRISGECLRTGGTLRCDDTNNDPRVDAEACQTLGLRSVAVVPVGRKPTVSGVLEAFSALPHAFDDGQVELLEELADLVMVAQCRSAESSVEVATKELANPRKSSLILAAVAMLVLSSWLVFRGTSHRHPLPAAARQPVSAPSASAVGDHLSAGVLTPKPSPVEVPRSAVPDLPPPREKESKTEKESLAGDVTVEKFAPTPASNRNTSANLSNGLGKAPAQGPEETAPPLSAVSTSFETTPAGLLFAIPKNLPQAPMKVSQGISGGTIEQQVNPIYPGDRLVPREGQVLLQAVVAEDGTVHDVKIITGHPLLARAAIQAVAQWRYRPFLLDGQPIPMTIEITLIFKRP